MMKKWILLTLALGLTACQSELTPQELDAQLQKKEAIVGGEDVAVTDPLTVTALSVKALMNPVEYRSGNNVSTNYDAIQCTASAIAPRVLLTAAHCLSSSALMYRVELPTVDGQMIYVKGHKAMMHPEYKSDNRIDLALILLDESLPENVRIVKMPTPDAQLKLSKIQAAGYGRKFGKRSVPGLPGTLRKTELNVLDYAPENPLFQVDQTQGKGVCQGDSGGPGLIEIDGETYVVGVVSKSSYLVTAESDPDRCSYRGIYVNVQYYVDSWITPTMRYLLME